MSTTQIYTHVAIQQLQQVHATTHPGVSRRREADGEGGESAGLDQPDVEAVLWAALADERDD